MPEALGIASGRPVRIIFAGRGEGRIADFSFICVEHLAFAYANCFPMEAHDRDRHRRFACQRIPRTMMDKVSIVCCAPAFTAQSNATLQPRSH